MCINRIKRNSGALTLLAVLLAWSLHLQEPRCGGGAGAFAPVRAPAGPPALPAPLGFAAASNSTSPLPAPSTAPAVLECALPLDVLAPTTRASPSALPSMRAPPVGPADALAAASRAASLARQTAQCGYVVSEQLGNASARLLPCDDFPRAVEDGFREGRDGPFFTPRCPSVWFTPSEACDLLQGLNKLILFVGDSIARQVQQGLFTALTGSYTQCVVLCLQHARARTPLHNHPPPPPNSRVAAACPNSPSPRRRCAAATTRTNLTAAKRRLPTTWGRATWCAQSGWKRATWAR